MGLVALAEVPDNCAGDHGIAGNCIQLQTEFVQRLPEINRLIMSGVCKLYLLCLLCLLCCGCQSGGGWLGATATAAAAIAAAAAAIAAATAATGWSCFYRFLFVVVEVVVV